MMRFIGNFGKVIILCVGAFLFALAPFLVMGALCLLFLLAEFDLQLRYLMLGLAILIIFVFVMLRGEMPSEKAKRKSKDAAKSR
jgi:hypothetical protein